MGEGIVLPSLALEEFAYMKAFDLAEPASIEEAVALLDSEDRSVRAIAGGTALMLMMKAGLFQPTRLVSLRRLDGKLRGISITPDGGLRIGAMTSLAELEYSSVLAGALPVVSHALRTLSNVRVRNVATIGGHLAHGDPHMDLPPILFTLDARVRAVSPRGERSIKIDELFVGYYETALARNELITEVTVPAQPPGICCRYEKFTARSADDWPTVGVAVWYRLDSNVISEARVAISAATDRPLWAGQAEAVLKNAAPTPQIFSRAADAAAEEVQPLADIRGTASYKREMVRVHVRRALERALLKLNQPG
jgi:aerobic carbon-monoxide dehydrogenase medium subunit